MITLDTFNYFYRKESNVMQLSSIMNSATVEPRWCPCQGTCGFTCAKTCHGCRGTCSGYCDSKVISHPGI